MIRNILIIFCLLLGTPSSFAGRVATLFPMSATSQQFTPIGDKADASTGIIFRIANISALPTKVKLTVRDLLISFNANTGTPYASPWTNPGAGWYNRTFTVAEHDLGEYPITGKGSIEIKFPISCVFNASGACTLNSSPPAAACSDAGRTLGGATLSLRGRSEIEIVGENSDRGALIASSSYYAGISCANQQNNQHSTEPFNGGRPF